MEYYLAVKDNIKFIGKWMRLGGEITLNWGIPEPKRQIRYVFPYMEILIVKSMATKL